MGEVPSVEEVEVRYRGSGSDLASDVWPLLNEPERERFLSELPEVRALRAALTEAEGERAHLRAWLWVITEYSDCDGVHHAEPCPKCDAMLALQKEAAPPGAVRAATGKDKEILEEHSGWQRELEDALFDVMQMRDALQQRAEQAEREVERLNEEIEASIKLTGTVIRCREGGGPERKAGSLALSIAKLRHDCEKAEQRAEQAEAKLTEEEVE